MNNQNKRKRCSNFSYRENEVLLQLVEQFRGKIECKKTDCVTNSGKEAAWEQLTVQFNNATESGRSKENLKSKWDSLKKNTRKNLATLKNNFKKTGGGPSCSQNLSSIEDKVLSIIGVSATGTNSKFDCDSEDFQGETGDDKIIENAEDETTNRLQYVPDVMEEDPISSITNIEKESEWNEWHPSLLKQPLHVALVDQGTEPQAKSSVQTNLGIGKRQKVPSYRQKKKGGEKSSLHYISRK